MDRDNLILGLWPIAGITTIGVTRQAARQTLQRAIECGIRHYDTAYSYGYDGESDRLLGEVLGEHPQRLQVHGKVGQRWDADRQRVIDARPATLLADAKESAARIGIESFDLLMLHSPDPQLPIERSAAAMQQMKEMNLCRRIGVCNVSVAQLEEFCAAADCSAIQCPLNLLQRDSLAELIPACVEKNIEVQVYWVLMKGLLAGKIARQHRFAPGDSRPRYDIFQGTKREHAHQVIDRMKELGKLHQRSVAQLSIGWAISQPGVTAAVIGARRPEQIAETAGAEPLTREEIDALDAAVAEAE